MEVGLSKAEWKKTTPAHFFAMLDYKRSQREIERWQADYRAGVVVATVETVMGGAKSFEPFRCFPEHRKKAASYIPDAEDRKSALRAYQAARRGGT